jgi:hypothetical protein
VRWERRRLDWRVELVKKVMELVAGEGRMERWGWRVVRSERILLNFLVLWVVMVVEFIIKFFLGITNII